MIEIRNTFEQVQERALIREIIEGEPEVLLILKTAALYTDSANRWHMYEVLRRRFLPFVGFHAQKPELATARHYQAMLDAIDYLLPDEVSSNFLEQEAF